VVSRLHPNVLYCSISTSTLYNKLLPVGAASLLLDRKFVHECGTVAHIEDVVVDASMRGKNLGRVLIETLKQLARELQAYKVILNCKEENMGFYEKAGFAQKNVEMSLYFA
jgi:glucosamine-phosphate N-acetyltransferase